ncbi:MAG TPA: alpha/beta hydrolase-fold protein [Micrococcaceae bacterium]|jgi:poly(3-hydroxybutyrate) depolymerase|nr:alpha/beta hydrolase-fold protein [Micrococcaceae bacterium]
MEGLLSFNIVQDPLLYGMDAASLLAVLYLVLRPMLLPSRFRPGFALYARPRPGAAGSIRDTSARAWLFTVLIAVAAGAATGVLMLWICESWLNVFGMPLDPDTRAWVIAAFAAVALGMVNLWRSRWWRKVTAVVAVAVFLATAALGVNAGYGLNQTLGSLLGVDNGHFLTLPRHRQTATQADQSPLWQTWKPPAGMPATGRSGPVSIPATASGFHARDAYLYLPPAALVADPPPLPVIVMMMGQPGSPDQDKSAVAELNSLESENHGLAPLFLTVDQLGDPYRNPLCVDSPSGNVYTYVTTDVVNFIRSKLNVAPGRVNWAVAGYSDGGECALSFGAKRPDLFGSLLDVSGELEPLNGSVQNTVNTVFRGNKAEFSAEEPANILKTHRYADQLAIFTSGSLDTTFTPQSVAAAADARAAGMTTYRFTGANIGHRGDSVDYGLKSGLPLLYKRFGLTAP